MVPVSVLILAKNEEKNMVDCINSVKFASDIVVIDDFSTDTTKQLSESLGARVITHAMAGDWGQQQTFAIHQAKERWVLFLDADERISEPLAEEIGKTVALDKPIAYWIRRENKFKHEKATHGILRPDYVDRLFLAEGSYVKGFVHPQIVTPYKNEKLKNVMYHFTYDNWNQYFGKFNNYTKLAAEKYKSEGKSCCFVKDIMFRPMWAFFKIYILNLGFLDGRIGFIFSVNHFFYTMTKYVRLYYLYKNNGKL